MHRLRLYLDTSAISVRFQDESGERQSITNLFFENVVRPRTHDVFISGVVLDEIQKTSDTGRRRLMLDFVRELELPLLEFHPHEDNVLRLAEVYLERGIIPRAKRDDALHVALATVHAIDCLITWNYRHLASVSREERIHLANSAEGFKTALRLITPYELAGSE